MSYFFSTKTFLPGGSSQVGDFRDEGLMSGKAMDPFSMFLYVLID